MKTKYILTIVAMLAFVSGAWAQKKGAQQASSPVATEPSAPAYITVVEPRFAGALGYSEGLCAVKWEGRWGFIDAEGKWAIEPQYEEVKPFSEGLAAAKSAGNWGFIDKSGRWIIKPQNKAVGSFSEGLAWVQVKDGGLYGYIDKAGGRWIIEPQFQLARDFSEGVAFVTFSNGDDGAVDKAGRSILTTSGPLPMRFSEGLAAISGNDDSPKFIDKNGTTRFYDKDITELGNLSEGLSFVKISYQDGAPYYEYNCKAGFIDRTGKMVISLQTFKGNQSMSWSAARSFSALPFSEGLAAVGKQGKWGFIDKTGAFIVEREFEAITPVQGGMAAVKSGGLWGVIKIPTGGEYITHFVGRDLERWQQKGEFESTAQYRERVNLNTREGKARELFLHYAGQFMRSPLFPYETRRGTIGSYDADNQTYLVTFPSLGQLIVRVPGRENAVSLKENWDRVRYSRPEFLPVTDSAGHERVVLSKLTLTDPARKAGYTWNIADTYAHEQVKITGYEFVSFAKVFGDNRLSGAPDVTEREIVLGLPKVDTEIPETGVRRNKTYALVIGNEDYTMATHDPEQNVPFAANDARVYARYCEKTLGIPQQNIKLLVNATGNNMLDGIDWLAGKAELENGQAELIFYYAGHGLPDEKTREPYLIPVDLNGRNLMRAVNLGHLYTQLDSHPSRRVTVLLDACFSGGARDVVLAEGRRAVKVTPNASMPRGNTVTFASSSGNESSGAYKEMQHGYFTYFLLKKLQETRGEVSYGDLYDYLYDNVRRTSDNDQRQTPQVIPSASVGDSWKIWGMTP